MEEEDSKQPESEHQPAGPSSSVTKTPDEEHDPLLEQNGQVSSNGNSHLTYSNLPKVPDAAPEKSSVDSAEKDAAFARLEKEKRLALIKAWEENEKAKANTKAYKRLSVVGSWENRKKASVEMQLKIFEEKWEKKKAEYEEKMKNKISEIHREAEEKRAMIEAKRGQDFLHVDEAAGKFRAAGLTPRKFLSCFG